MIQCVISTFSSHMFARGTFHHTHGIGFAHTEAYMVHIFDVESGGHCEVVVWEI